mgnify:CR=1 FL=1
MAVTIRVTAKTARVQAQPVHPIHITPADGARVVVVPKPGPPGEPGADGHVAPEDLEQIVDDVLDDLTPPVSLVLLFENGLA